MEGESEGQEIALGLSDFTLQGQRWRDFPAESQRQAYLMFPQWG